VPERADFVRFRHGGKLGGRIEMNSMSFDNKRVNAEIMHR
jgi:hypothetical protein